MWRALLYPPRPRLRPWRLRCPCNGNSPDLRRRKSLFPATDLAVPALGRWTTQSSTPLLLQQLTVFFSCSPPHIFVTASDCGRILHLAAELRSGGPFRPSYDGMPRSMPTPI